MLLGRRMLAQTRIIHVGREQKLDKLRQYVLEIGSKVKEVENQIVVWRKIEPSVMAVELEKIVSEQFGKRRADKIFERYGLAEQQNLWGLYNAVTYVGTHETKSEASRDWYLAKANEMAEEFEKAVLKTFPLH
jgi:hypothetical protein